MEKIATDTYSFERLREGSFVYVDKTAIFEQLANGSIGFQFFIARPRRFGKSLMVSTLQCLFEGRRELFKGLAIEPKWDWSKKWPVVRLDMGSCQADSIEEFEEKVGTQLERNATRLGVAFREGKSVSSQLQFLFDALTTKSEDGRVVLLVDELKHHPARHRLFGGKTRHLWLGK